jgi:hypothetical protein
MYVCKRLAFRDANRFEEQGEEEDEEDSRRARRRMAENLQTDSRPSRRILVNHAAMVVTNDKVDQINLIN